MQFKTAAEIKAAKEAAGKSSQQEEKRKEKLAEKSNRKYARMAEESAKREANKKLKPQVKVLPGVIIAPVLQALKAESKPVVPQEPSSPKPGAKQIWDDKAKQWVKTGS